MKAVSKKFLSVFLAICMVITMFPVAAFGMPASKSWQYMGDSGFSEEGASSPIIVLDSGDTPYVTYNSNGIWNTKMYDSGNHNWKNVGDSIGYQLFSFAVSDSGVPYRAYTGGCPFPDDYFIYIEKYVEGSWQTVWGRSFGFTDGIPDATTPSAISLAINQDGTPYVACSTNDGYNNYSLSVYKGDEADTGLTSVGEAISGGKDNVTLALDSDDTPYVAYRNINNFAAVKKYSDDSWTDVGGSASGESRADHMSFTLGSDGTPYVAYNNAGNKGVLCIKRYDSGNGSWTQVGNGFSMGTSASGNFSLACNDSNLYLAYAYNGSLMSSYVWKCATNNYGMGWSAVGDGLSNRIAYSIAIDGDGMPCVALLNSAGKLSVMKYADLCTVTYSAGAHGTLNGADGETVEPGSHPSDVPEVTPASGYKFTGWSSDGDTTVLNDTQLKEQTVTASVTYTACYIRDFSADAAWQAVGYATFSGGMAQDISMVFNNGTPYVAYRDSVNSYGVTVNKYNSETKVWEVVGKKNLSDGNATSCCLATNSSGALFVAYRDVTASGKATVRKYNPQTNEWELVGARGFTSTQIRYLHFVIAADDTPYLAYSDWDSGFIHVEKYNESSGWSAVGSSITARPNSTFSFAVSGDGTPYLEYLIDSDSVNTYKCILTKYTEDAGWETVGGENVAEHVSGTISLAVDRKNNPYVIFNDRDNNFKAAVKKYDVTNSRWETVGEAGFSSDTFYYPSMAFDDCNSLYVAYGDNAYSLKLTVMRYTAASGWKPLGKAGFSSGAANYISLAVDSDGIPCVAFADSANSLKAIVMKLTEPSTCTVTYSEGEHGTLSGSENETVVSGGKPANVPEVTPDTGYTFAGWSSDGGTTMLSATQLKQQTLTADITYTAYYTQAITQFTKDGITYEVTSTNPNTVSVVAKGNGGTYSGSVAIPASVSYNNITYSVTAIATNAFSDSEGLTSVTVPSGVTSIGANAFTASTNLASIMVDGSNANYSSQDGVLFNKAKATLLLYPCGKAGTTYTIPSGVKSIGIGAFRDCAKLTGVTIPSGVMTINQGAFSGCTCLKNITFWGGAPKTVIKQIFANDTYPIRCSIPAGTKSEYEKAFSLYVKSNPVQLIFVETSVLSAPTDLSWSGALAKWSAAANASGYSVQLKKDGVDCGTAVTVGSSVLQYDFSSAIAAAGSGTYTFAVTALGDGTGYSSSEASSSSTGYAYTPSPSGGSSSGGSSSGSSSSGGSTATVNPAPSNETKVDASGNTSTVSTVAGSVTTAGDTAQISATVTNITTDTTGTNAALDTGKQAKVKIELPKDAVMQQLAAKKDVDLTVTVPTEVAKGANSNVAVTIDASKDILAAAKASGSDLTIKIKDADTQQLAYSWTFKGEDLAKSTAPVTDVNISMAVRLTTEVPQVNKVTPQTTGLVLMFNHSGALPSTANVTFSAKEKGFQPGQTLYFYYYNPTTGQIEAQGRQYTVDADGNVTVQITHCSNYVLLPHSARTITLDTRTYTVNPGGSYITGVKLTGVVGAKIKAYSSAKGVAAVTVLKNGNVKATGVKNGSTYIMIDIYDSKNKFLTHASVLLTVQKAVKPSGSSARQYGLF